MTNKLKLIWSIVVVLFLVVAVVVYIIEVEGKDELQGRLVFADTYDVGEKIDKIVIKTTEDEVVLVQKNSYWLLDKMGGYFADFKQVYNFLTSINQSVYSVKLPYNEENVKSNYLLSPLEDKENSGMLITTYVGDNVIDKVIVGLSNGDNYFWARRPNVEEVWLVNGNFNLPIYQYHWLLNPVLSIVDEVIEEINVGDNKISRKDGKDVFTDKDGNHVNTKVLLDIISDVKAINVLTEDEFKKVYTDSVKVKYIDFVTFFGLKIVCNIYYDEKNTWLNVYLTTTPLPKTSVNDYIKDNNFLYKGWYFKLKPEQGSVLQNFNLI